MGTAALRWITSSIGWTFPSCTKGISKRPLILTVEQFFFCFELVPQPHRTKVLGAICSGVRAEEVLAIEKPDIHFEKLSLQLFRAVVHGRVKFVKTEYSEDELPLDPDLAAILLDWICQCELEARETFERIGIEVEESDLFFTCPVTGRHYHASPIQQDYFCPAWSCLVACPTCGAGAGVWCLTDSLVLNGKRLEKRFGQRL